MTKRSVYTDEVGLHVPADIGTKPLWSLGTRVGNFMFCAGQPGVDRDGNIVSPDIKEQAYQAYENARMILEAGGFSFGDVAKIRMFTETREDYEAMTEVRTPYYEKHFPDGHYPASTALITGPLAVPGLRIEVEVFACKDKSCFDTDAIVKRVPVDMKVQPLWRLGAKTENLLWVTGQPGFDLEARVVGPDVRSQTQQSLDNVRMIVEAGGFSFSEIVKLNTYLVDGGDYADMVEVRNAYLQKHFPNGGFPVSATVTGDFPPTSMKVEIEAVAARGRKQVFAAPSVSSTVPMELPSQPLYSQAIRVGPWVFVAGQGALDASGQIVGRGDARAQATQVLANVKAILEAAGAAFSDIVHQTVWMRSPEVYEPLNEVRVPFYRAHFPDGDYPASTAILGPTPLEGLLLEIEVIAYSEQEE